MKSRIVFILIFCLLFSFYDSFSQEKTKKLVYKFNIKENIAPAIWRQTKQAFAAADSLKADLFLIHMNTYGGTVVDADSIRTRILNSKIPVVVFIDNNAASAGALISLACDSIYLRNGASMGAATVVNQTGGKISSFEKVARRRTANNSQSNNPIGIPRERYSGSKLASIRHTTLTGPPSAATKSNRLSIFSNSSNDAAIASVDNKGSITSRKK